MLIQFQKNYTKNSGDRPIQVGSHYHFYEVNEFLNFDRKSAYEKA